MKPGKPKSWPHAAMAQRKTVTGAQLPGRRGTLLPPSIHASIRASMPVPKVLQTKKNGPQAAPLKIGVTQPNRPGVKQTTVQRMASRVVQAVKYFPNLHPGAIEPINPSNIFRLNSFAGQYRLHQVNSHGVNVPNQQYNFVRTREGETLLHNRYRHPSIAEGRQVLYAGEIYFNNGRLQWWSNGSGHYQPAADDAEQAKLPMENFYSYQQIIKGEHTRKKDKG